MKLSFTINAQCLISIIPQFHNAIILGQLCKAPENANRGHRAHQHGKERAVRPHKQRQQLRAIADELRAR